MKRGLALLDPAETSSAVFASRLDALRERTEASGARIALIYGDVSRSGDIHYLTNLCLYWNEAVLAVPLGSRPVLITKLSKRVQPWMHRTSILEDIRSGPRLAESIGKLLDEHIGGRPDERTDARIGGRAGPIGLVDLPWWPNGLVAELQGVLPHAELRDIPAAVRDRRRRPSAEEMSLLQRGAELLERALEPIPARNDSAQARNGGAQARTAVAVSNIRRSGFLDATVSCGRLPDGSEFTDAIGQYRYVWLRRCRSRGGPTADAANGVLHAVLNAARPGATEAQLRELAASQAGELCRSTLAGEPCKSTLSCVAYPDTETRGLYRADESQRPFEEGEVMCIALELASDAGVLPASETVKVTRSGAIALSAEESA